MKPLSFLRPFALLATAAIALGLSACCQTQVAAELKPRTLALMDHAKTESYALNRSEADAVQSKITTTAASLQNSPFAGTCREQWKALGDSTGVFFKRWETKARPLSTEYVDSAKDLIGKSFDNIR
jgi:hypothetical protein